MSHIETIVQRVKEAYEVLSPQGKTDAYDGAESTRITAEMLLLDGAINLSWNDFLQAVYEKANTIDIN